MIEGFVKVPTEMAERAVENFISIQKELIDIIKEVKPKAINDIKLTRWQKFCKKTKEQIYEKRRGAYEFCYGGKYLAHMGYISEQDEERILDNNYFERSGCVRSIENLCSVGEKYVYLNPIQAKFVSEFSKGE